MNRLNRWHVVVTFMALSLLVAFASVSAVQAQDAVDLAGYFPLETDVYLELETTADTEAALQRVVPMIETLMGEGDFDGGDPGDEAISFQTLITAILPGMSFEDDLRPWLGERAAVGINFGPGADPETEGVLFALPVADRDAFDPFLDVLTAALVYEGSQGDARVYTVPGERLVVAVLPDVLLIGTGLELQAAMTVRDGDPALTDDESFQRLQVALPSESLGMIAVSGDWLQGVAGDEGVSEVNRIAELLLRFHPTESELEDALINDVEWFERLGVSFDMDETSLSITGALILDADHPAPTLPTEGAGSGLLDYIPGSAILMVDSYDLTSNLAMLGSLILGPQIETGFDNIVEALENPNAATPTPAPTPSVDEMLAQTEPTVAEIEAALGMSLPELVDLLDGEYAFALFSGLEEPLLGTDTQGYTGALWLQTDDPQAVIDLLDRVMQQAVVPTLVGTSQRMMDRDETYNNRDVTIWIEKDEGDLIAYGILSDDVVFITVGESAPLVIQAALGDGVLSQHPLWPGTTIEGFGPDNEALLYANVREINAIENDSNVPPVQLFVAGFDAQADGVFVLNLFASLE